MSDAEVDAFLKEFADTTKGWLLMMLSGGAEDTADAGQESSEHLSVVGFFPGRGVWGKSFWDKKFEGAKEDRAAIAAKLAEIKEDLATGGTRRRYEELNAVKNNSMRPFWEHLGFKSREEMEGFGQPRLSLEERLALFGRREVDEVLGSWTPAILR